MCGACWDTLGARLGGWVVGNVASDAVVAQRARWERTRDLPGGHEEDQDDGDFDQWQIIGDDYAGSQARNGRERTGRVGASWLE